MNQRELLNNFREEVRKAYESHYGPNTQMHALLAVAYAILLAGQHNLPASKLKTGHSGKWTPVKDPVL